jgi:predicted O-methyltransferase YrrM
MVSNTIKQIFNTNIVKDSTGREYPLKSNIDLEEGYFLFDLIKNNNSISRVIEIGCAYGISSLFLGAALKYRNKPDFIIIDPNQTDGYHNIGTLNLEKDEINFFKLLEESSEFALPRLLVEETNSYDLVFIDGYHTFDQVLLDFYYSNRLIKKGGFIVFDDCSYFSISKALTYILKYPSYEFHSQVEETSNRKKFIRFFLKRIPDFIYTYFLPLKITNLYNRVRYTSMVAIQKVSEDHRNWKWFVDF